MQPGRFHLDGTAGSGDNDSPTRASARQHWWGLCALQAHAHGPRQEGAWGPSLQGRTTHPGSALGARPGPPAGPLPASGPSRQGPPRPGWCHGPR